MLMSVRTGFLLVPLALLAAACPLGAQQDSVPQTATAKNADLTALVHRALVENKRDLKTLRDYLFVSDTTLDAYDKNNEVTKTGTSRKEIFYIDGQQAERTLEENGHTPAEDARKKQEKKLDEQIRDARSANPQHREERQAKAAKQLANRYAVLEDVAEGYDWTLAGEHPCNGRRCLLLRAEPREHFKGKSPLRALLPFLHGTLLVDAERGQWVQIDATPLHKLGAGIAYLSADSTVHLHQDEVAAGLWVTTREDIRINTRLLWEHKNLRMRRENYDFRRFAATAAILPATEQAQPVPEAIH
jgi:uncharacterized protein (DUF1800 family)